MKTSSAIFIIIIVHSSIDNFIITSAEKLNSNNLDLEITPIELIKKEGYEAEEHKVTTEDGYILTLHRIVGKTGSTPVFLQHGLLVSSFEWLISGKENGLGFVLADHGYDVWLGNSRGNIYSRSHVKFDPSIDRNFWNFSWHEMGIYDLPAVINYIKNMKNESLLYVGHSMGTTMFFVMASEKPEMAKKVKAMFALAPVTYFYSSNSPYAAFHSILDSVEMLFESLRIYEVFSPEWRKLMYNFAKEHCYKQNVLINENNICIQILALVSGGDPSRYDLKIMSSLAAHSPEGTSTKTGLHYLQEIGDGRFKQYDYGIVKNLEVYNTDEPPQYNISKIQVPVGVFWAEKDTYFAHPLDVERLYNLLPNKILSYKIKNPKYIHTDFMFGVDSFKYLFPKLLSVMKTYR